MPEKFFCEICGAPMKLLKKLSSVRKLGKTVRRRRFGCTVCDFTEVIYGDGSGDLKNRPQQGIDDARKMYDQEEENREL